MADWIKMRTDLYRHPKVIAMADALARDLGDAVALRRIARNAVVGALVSVWGVARARGKRRGNNLIINKMNLDVVDDLADLTGFGQLMADCGWLRPTAQGLVFPRFFAEHNVDPDDRAKEKNRERQRRFRERQRSDAGNAEITPREEIEKRESKSKKKKGSARRNAAPPDGEPDPAPAERKADPIWDTIADLFHPSGVPETRRSFLGAIVRDLKKLGATPDAIRLRHKHATDADWTPFTPRAIVDHWDTLAQPVLRRGEAQPGRSRISAPPGKYAHLAQGTPDRPAGDAPAADAGR